MERQEVILVSIDKLHTYFLVISFHSSQYLAAYRQNQLGNLPQIKKITNLNLVFTFKQPLLTAFSSNRYK